MPVAKSPQVMWIPAHPSYGSVSMARYWNSLDAEREAGGAFEGVPIACPLVPVSLKEVTRGSKIARIFQGHLKYGVSCKRAYSGEVCHVLDHSFAHLRRWLPRNAATVITVHDLFPLSVPDCVTPAQRKRFRWNVGHIAQYDHVIAVSKYTESALIELLGIKPAQISVVPNGVSGLFAKGAARSAEPGQTSFPIISVGNEGVRKNLKSLAPLFRKLPKNLRDKIVLWRVGQKLNSETLHDLEDVLGAKQIIEHGRVSDSALKELYSLAKAFVFPSSYEGFGLPVLESMSQGCPVLASNRTSLPEAGGSAALYFDPDNAEDGAEKLGRLMQDAKLWNSLSQSGHARSESFTWARHAKECLAIYRSLDRVERD